MSILTFYQVLIVLLIYNRISWEHRRQEIAQTFPNEMERSDEGLVLKKLHGCKRGARQ